MAVVGLTVIPVIFDWHITEHSSSYTPFSVVAIIFVFPTSFPVTNPFSFTLAILLSSLSHITFVFLFAFAGFTFAFNCTVFSSLISNTTAFLSISIPSTSISFEPSVFSPPVSDVVGWVVGFVGVGSGGVTGLSGVSSSSPQNSLSYISDTFISYFPFSSFVFNIVSNV